MNKTIQSQLRKWGRTRSMEVIPPEKLMDMAAEIIDVLVEALEDCEAELNAYYNIEYGADHPHSRKQLANAIKYNPATEALVKTRGDAG